MGPTSHVTTRLRQAEGRLGTTAMARIEREMPWFSDLSAQQRAWIAMVVQGGVRSFVDWYSGAESSSPKVLHDVFGAAPRAFAGQISLARTVAMVRLAIAVVEENLVDVLGSVDAPDAVAGVTRFGREIGFAIAEVYARAAEQRGAWDARLEALVVDAALRGDTDGTLESRASALGWNPGHRIVAVVGGVPEDGNPVDVVRDLALAAHLHALCAVQGDRMVVLLGGKDPAPTSELVKALGPGPVVTGPTVTSLASAGASAAAALSGHRAVSGWAKAPDLVEADALLPERVLSGDQEAGHQLVREICLPLAAAGNAILPTLQAYLDSGGSLEATARELFVHANTVRYRLRRAFDITGLQPLDSRDAYILRMALTLWRLQAPSPI